MIYWISIEIYIQYQHYQLVLKMIPPNESQVLKTQSKLLGMQMERNFMLVIGICGVLFFLVGISISAIEIDIAYLFNHNNSVSRVTNINYVTHVTQVSRANDFNNKYSICGDYIPALFIGLIIYNVCVQLVSRLITTAIESGRSVISKYGIKFIIFSWLVILASFVFFILIIILVGLGLGIPENPQCRNNLILRFAFLMQFFIFFGFPVHYFKWIRND